MIEQIHSKLATFPNGKQRLVRFSIEENPDIESEPLDSTFRYGVWERIEGDEENDEIVHTDNTIELCEAWINTQMAHLNHYVKTRGIEP